MKDTTFKANVLFIKHCIAGANTAWKRRQFRLAETFRNGAREALDDLDLALERAAPVDPETARRREVARAYAAVIQKGFGRVQ